VCSLVPCPVGADIRHAVGKEAVRGFQGRALSRNPLEQIGIGNRIIGAWLDYCLLEQYDYFGAQ
jgi:hypothetical protein